MVAIGETTYASLAEALAAAQAGDTLTFLADITQDVTISTKVTIDGAGKTYTGKMTAKADVTVKNVNFDGNGYNGYAFETRGAAYVTIEDCTATNYGYGFVQLASGTALTTVKNVIVSNMNYGVKVDYSNAVVLENVDITANVAAVLNSNYGEKTITIKNSDLNILGTWTRNNTTKTTYVFEGENTVDSFITDAAIDNFKLANENSTLTAPEGLTVTTDLAGCEVDYEDGTYYVVYIKEQTQQIVAGWNWYSSYLDIEGTTGLEKLQTALTNGGIIKAQNGDQRKYELGAWRGSLTNYDMTQMYMINVSEDQELSINAPLADAADYTIELVPNWNWIGYPSNNANVDINVALNNLTPAAGDRIKTQNNGFAEFAFGKWMGALKQLVPGQGYMYNNKSGETKTFVYNAETVRGSVEANVTAENNYWTPNSRLYPYNMTVTAVLDEMGDNYEIAAFVNGEVRGSARPIYIEEVDAYMFFLTIHGENVEEMTFKGYDLTTGEEFELINRMNYSNDAIVGSVNEPYAFTRGTVGLEELSSNFNIYPNPTTTDREINLTTTCDKVEVFNALGVKVAEYQNVDTIDALETAGIYVIRVTNNNNVQHCRLVVK